MPPCPQPALVLASASPRRRDLLAQAGVAFQVRTADVPEIRAEGETPGGFALRLAREGAACAATGVELRYLRRAEAEEKRSALQLRPDGIT